MAKSLSVDLKGTHTICCLSSEIWKGGLYTVESASFLGSVRRFFRDSLLVVETRGSFGQLVQKTTEDPALRQRLLQVFRANAFGKLREVPFDRLRTRGQNPHRMA